MCHPSDAWADASPHVRHALRHGMREWALARHLPTNRHVLYWIVPKSAHTRIMRFLRVAPFALINVSDGFAGGPDERWSGGPRRGAAEGAIRRRAIAKLEWAQQLTQPLEFTFVRDPLSHLISASAQLVSCLRSWNCINRNVTWPFETVHHVEHMLDLAQRDELPHLVTNVTYPTGYDPRIRRHRRCSAWEVGQSTSSLRGCARHLYPQTAGYDFEGSPGFLKRVKFVGRVEHLAEDWSRLLARLHNGSQHGTHERMSEAGVIMNKRGATLRATSLETGGVEWQKVAKSGMVRRWLDADVRCLGRVTSVPFQNREFT